MAFNTWRAEQPDANEPGLVLSANDHASKTCSVWWAGPETDLLRRMKAEALARHIHLIVHPAAYSKSAIESAVELIFDGRRSLEKVGFSLQTVGGPTPTFQGLTVGGFPLSDENAGQLEPELVASVRQVLGVLLSGADVQLSDVKVKYNKVNLLL